MEQSFDFQDLSKPNFDVNSWVSKQFLNLPDDADLQKILDKFNAQLGSEIQNTTSKLNTLSQQVMLQVPRVVREFEQTHKEVNKLQQEITAGFNEAENVQKKTTASMTTLERLDNIKSNLLATSAALQEADKWTSLGKEIEQLLDSGDVHRSYECIIGMEKSLSVLDQASSEERRLILEEVKNRLEALATKHIIQAFETNDTENATRFFIMFSQLERTQQYIKYFENSEKLKLTQEWRNLVELSSFKDAITKFYDGIIDHLHTKVMWCKEIFSESTDDRALNVLLGLYAETFDMLEPSVQYCFEVETRKQPFLDLLVQFNQATHRFAQNLRQFIESCNVQPEAGKLLQLLKVLFAPFISQYSKYSKHQENLVVARIQDAIKGLTMAGSPANGEMSGLLQERIDCAKRLLPDIILSVKEGEEKILLLNHGYGYYHFGKGINNGLAKFKDWYTDIFRTLEKSTTNADKKRSLLENSLSFCETCGEILQQIVNLDNTMTSNCQKVMSKLNLPSQSEWDSYSEIYVDRALLAEITQFLQSKNTLLGATVDQFKKLCKDATQMILRVTADPIESQLKKNFVLTDCNLKEAIPSEYITQMGEYLMLLPQNLDPFITTEVSSLTYAFDQTGEDETKSPVDYILSNVSLHVCEVYTERLLKITYLSDGQAKQLAQDIDYFSSVLEDLGVQIMVLNQDLMDLSKLMKMYGTLTETSVVEKVSPRILSAVKKMKIKPVQQ